MMKLTELEEKYPCSEKLVTALQKALIHASPEEKEIVDRFVNVLSDYLSKVPYRKEVVQAIYSALTHGVTVKSITHSLEKTLRSMKRKEEITPKPVKEEVTPKKIESINDLAKVLYEKCNEKTIESVLHTLYDFIPPNKQKMALHEAVLVMRSDNYV
ncbi:hypothetical protein [Acidianus bottle-shaped virus 3 strain ABV3]|uniref:Uncharacterized protein n=1 Tax=Acidianus bottle-shaped virus 3 strain ABV3 TaxID=1732174 RepID=A0A0N9PB07_9VIRU|nr:hypothetical protein AVU00_gp40 [Acidianus bottle-shaped virus 3 strain ABV3]ALG96842.1 hypothetical protein [Acidianus bottle-shaped virus 3 strain ABV3]